MKKLLALSLAAALALSLLACGKKTESPAPTTEPSAPSTQLTDPSTEPSVPSSPITEPSSEITEPSTEITEPSTEITEPSTDPTQPSTEATEPPSKFDPTVCADAFGVWYSVVRLDGSQLSLRDFESDLFFNLIWVFGGTGHYNILPDPNQFDQAIADYEQLLIEYMVEGRRLIYISEAKLNGISSSKANKQWRNDHEPTARAESTAAVTALNLKVRFSQLSASGEYYIENGRLYLVPTEGTGCSMGFSSGEEGLVLVDCDNSRYYNSLSIHFPLDLTPDPFEPIVPPTPTEPSEPSSEPSEPSSEPSEPSSEPSEPSSEPSEPGSEPSEEPTISE